MNFRVGTIFFAFVWLSIILLSCHKPGDTKAVVIVKDTAEHVIANVKVTVEANPNGSYIDPQNGILNEVQYTDASGQVTFKFKNKAILNVKAENYTAPYHRDGKGLLILEEGKTIEKIIHIK